MSKGEEEVEAWEWKGETENGIIFSVALTLSRCFFYMYTQVIKQVSTGVGIARFISLSHTVAFTLKNLSPCRNINWGGQVEIHINISARQVGEM